MFFNFRLNLDFEKDGRPHYYAVCSVDAHGLTSGYSTQFRVKFNRNENKIEVDQVSPEGAPKAYPNFFLRGNLNNPTQGYRLLEDVMKDSNHSSMKIYFDPEYLNVTADNRQMKDVKLLATFTDHDSPDNTSSLPIKNKLYKFSIVNIDRQISRTLTIGINDIRTALPIPSKPTRAKKPPRRSPPSGRRGR